jgi:hypothetical protein
MNVFIPRLRYVINFINTFKELIMNKYVLALSLVASLSTVSFSANAFLQGQGAAGLVSEAHTNTNTTSSFIGVASTSTDAIAVIQPMVHTPTGVNGKVSAMGSAINTIQPIVDAPKTN